MGCFQDLTEKNYFGWIVFAAGMLKSMLIDSRRQMISSIIADLKEKSPNSTTMLELNWVGEISASASFLAMPLVTMLLIHLRRPYQLGMLTGGVLMTIAFVTSAFVSATWQLFICYSIPVSIGAMLFNSITPMVIGEYFHKKHPKHVLGTSFGVGVSNGTWVVGPLIAFVVQWGGWRWGFLAMAVLAVITAVITAVAFVPKRFNNAGDEDVESSDHPTKKKGSVLLLKVSHLAKNPQIALWLFQRALHNIVLSGIMINITSYMHLRIELDMSMSYLPLMIIGIGQTSVTILFALIGDYIRGRLVLIYLFGSLLLGASLLVIHIFSSDVVFINCISLIMGIGLGLGDTFLYSISGEVFLLDSSIAYPWTRMLDGLAMLIAPLFTGLVIDLYGFERFFEAMLIMTWLRFVLLCGITAILCAKACRREAVESQPLLR